MSAASSPDSGLIGIEILTRAKLERYLEDLCRIEREAVENSQGTYRDPWQAENFLGELPGKWDYSRLVKKAGQPAGFFIFSRKSTQDGEKYLHLHRVATGPVARGQNVMGRVFQETFAQARQEGLAWFTTSQMEYHPAMLQWYLRVLGVDIMQERPLIERFIGPLVEETLEKGGRLVNRQSGIGRYLVIKRL